MIGQHVKSIVEGNSTVDYLKSASEKVVCMCCHYDNDFFFIIQVCTTKLECFCHPGYRGLACEQKMTTPPTSPPPPTTQTHSTTSPPSTTYTEAPVTDDSVVMMKKGRQSCVVWGQFI